MFCSALIFHICSQFQLVLSHRFGIFPAATKFFRSRQCLDDKPTERRMTAGHQSVGLSTQRLCGRCTFCMNHPWRLWRWSKWWEVWTRLWIGQVLFFRLDQTIIFNLHKTHLESNLKCHFLHLINSTFRTSTTLTDSIQQPKPIQTMPIHLTSSNSHWTNKHLIPFLRACSPRCFDLLACLPQVCSDFSACLSKIRFAVLAHVKNQTHCASAIPAFNMAGGLSNTASILWSARMLTLASGSRRGVSEVYQQFNGRVIWTAFLQIGQFVC